MSARASSRRRGLRRLLLAAIGIALVLGLTVSAYAYLTASGRGRAVAAVATLPAPTITSATAGAASVRLDWSAVTAPGAGTVSYYVTRDGGNASAACPSAASPRAVTSCTDTGVSTASHTYRVTAKWRSWTGTSTTSNVTVTYGPATQLVYTTQPSDGTGGVAIPTQPVVTARDASNRTVADWSGTVTLSIRSGTGTSGAVLSGCTSTLTGGVTRFAGCAINRVGDNYQLRATDRTLTVDSSNVDISAGPAAQLAFTTQPSGATGGNAFSTQPVVIARDAGGNTASGYSGTVTLSIASGTGTSGAAITNCSGSRSNSVTTFSNCEIDKSGTGYQLHAEDRTLALSGPDSSAFNVTVGSTSALVFSTQPGGSPTGGVAFPTQPVVTAVDAGGNTVTSYSNTITLAIRSGTGTSGAVLSAGCRGTRVSGVTTFSGCGIDRSGTGYQLRASDFSRQVDSASFNVTVGPLAQLVFTTSPSSSTTAGTAFATQPVVAGADAGGNAITSYAGTVTLSITRDPGALSGCTSSLRSGAATFSGCKVSRSGTGYQLHATDGTFGGDSSTFTITAGTATQLSFTTQPAGAIGRVAFTTQPVVTAYDALGNVATSYSGTVNLGIKSGTGTSGAALTNCNGNRSNGVTSFSNCEIDKLGSGYVLRATESAGSLTAESTAFNVTVGSAVRFALTATPTSVTAGDAGTSLRITALDAGGNTATGYTGAHPLTFSGANRSPSGAAPTVTDSSGAAIAFGSPTSITFTSGVATVSGATNGVMVLYDDGSDSIGVSENTIDEDGNQLDMTIATGRAARLAWTSVNESTGSLSSPCFFTCTNSGVSSSSTFQARVTVTDASGNTVSGLGSGHTVRVFTPTSGAGSGGSFTSPASGTSVTLTISSSGSATSTSSFTFRAQTSGSWTQNTFSAETLAGTVYTAATAIMSR